MHAPVAPALTHSHALAQLTCKQSASILQQREEAAVRTLYVRNVPDEVVEGLEKLAERAGMSVSTFVARELGEIARRSRNAEILAALPVRDDIDLNEIVAAIHAGRQEADERWS